MFTSKELEELLNRVNEYRKDRTVPLNQCQAYLDITVAILRLQVLMELEEKHDK